MSALFTNPDLFWHAIFICGCAGALIVLSAWHIWETYRDAWTDYRMRRGFKLARKRGLI